MTWTLLDHGGAALNTAGSGSSFTFPAGAASTGNVLNIGVSSDTFVAAPVDNLGATWTDRKDNIGNQGVYVYEKIAVGGETSVTITTTGNAPTGILFFRLSGALNTTPADTATTNDSEAGAFTASPSAPTGTLGGVNDVVIAYVCQGGLTAGVPTGITWSSGFTTSTFAQTTGGTTGSDQQILASIKSPAGTASENPTTTWTHAVQNVVTIVVSYVGAATVTLPPVQAPRRRTLVIPKAVRRRVGQVVPAQVVVANPPRPTTVVPRRIRGLVARRPRAVTQVRPQVNPPFPVNEVKRGRQPRSLLGRRGHVASPVPAQIVAPPVYPVRPVRSRLNFAHSSRGRQAVPSPDQMSPMASSRSKVRQVRPVRGHAPGPIPPQVVVPPAFVPARVRQATVRAVTGRRARAVALALRQDSPLFVFHTRVRSLRIFRSMTRNVVPAQVVVPPGYVSVKVRQAAVRTVMARRGRTILLAPAQDQAVAQTRGRLRGLRIFRGSARSVIPAQATVLPPPYVPQLVRARLKVAKVWRSRSAQPVPVQVVVIPPAYPPQMWRARTKFGMVARGQAVQPVSAQATPAVPAYPVQSRRLRGRGLRLFRSRHAAPVQVQNLPSPSMHAHYAAKQAVARRPRLAVPPAVQSQPPISTRIKLRIARLVRRSERGVIPAATVIPAPLRQFVHGHRAVVGPRARRLSTTGWMTRTVAPPRPGSMGSRTFTARLIDTTSASAMTVNTISAELNVDMSGPSLTSEIDSGRMVNEP